MLIVVNPGIVFTSLTKICPVWRETRKSTRAMEVVQGSGQEPGFYLLRKTAGITGQDLRSAQPSLDENGRPAVGFSLTREGSSKFGKLTGDNIGRSLAIVLDNRVQSAPRIDGRINDNGRIYGSFTQEQVKDLSLVLNSGALPASMSYLEERVIGPTLGADSIKSGIYASLAGLALVIIFMLVYYKLSGINAIVAMVANLVILLGLMAYFGFIMEIKRNSNRIILLKDYSVRISLDFHGQCRWRLGQREEDRRGRAEGQGHAAA